MTITIELPDDDYERLQRYAAYWNRQLNRLAAELGFPDCYHDGPNEWAQVILAGRLDEFEAEQLMHEEPTVCSHSLN